MEVLLKNKANPNPAINVDNVPPLILATVLEYTEIVKVLLKYNAEVDAVYGRNHLVPPLDHLVPPLMYAIFAGHLELVKLLCDRVANIHFESTPKLDCGVSKFSTDELANALGNHKITDILKSPLQTESEENACDSDDLEEIHPTKKLTVDNTSSVRVFTKETQEHFFSRIVKYVKCVDCDDEVIACVIHTTRHAEMSRIEHKFDSVTRSPKLKIAEKIGEDLLL